MTPENTPDGGWQNWKVLSGTAVAALVLFLVAAIIRPQTSLLLFALLAAPVLIAFSIGLLIYLIAAKRRGKWRRVLSMLAVFWAFAGLFFVYNMKSPLAIRSIARWIVWSHDYKNEVLAQPNSGDGQLKHIEWDGWGWAGQDTVVYLVYDPGDAISSAASHEHSGRFPGIPCEVADISRLENHWYAAQFYTNDGWDRCGD